MTKNKQPTETSSSNDIDSGSTKANSAEQELIKVKKALQDTRDKRIDYVLASVEREKSYITFTIGLLAIAITVMGFIGYSQVKSGIKETVELAVTGDIEDALTNKFEDYADNAMSEFVNKEQRALVNAATVMENTMEEFQLRKDEIDLKLTELNNTLKDIKLEDGIDSDLAVKNQVQLSGITSQINALDSTIRVYRRQQQQVIGDLESKIDKYLEKIAVLDNNQVYWVRQGDATGLERRLNDRYDVKFTDVDGARRVYNFSIYDRNDDKWSKVIPQINLHQIAEPSVCDCYVAIASLVNGHSENDWAGIKIIPK